MIRLHIVDGDSTEAKCRTGPTPKPIDPVALLSAVAVTAKKAETYSPETYVIDLADLHQILFELQDNQLQKT